MEAWMGVIGAVAGAVATWGLTEAKYAVTERRRSNRELQSAAFDCFERLLKIRSSRVRSDEKQLTNELYSLGGDIDRYRDCITSSTGFRGRHWSMYRRMMPLLLEHDLSSLDEIIDELERISGGAG